MRGRAGGSAGGSAGAENGSVEVKMRPSVPTRAQSEAEAQEAEKSPFSGGSLKGRNQVFEVPGAGPAARIARGEDVAVVIDRHTATRSGAGDVGDPHRAAAVGLAPGAGGAGARIGRGEDVSAHVAGGAEQGRYAGDSLQADGPARSPRFLPGRGAAGWVGRDEDPPFPPTATQSEGVPQETPRRLSEPAS